MNYKNEIKEENIENLKKDRKILLSKNKNIEKLSIDLSKNESYKYSDYKRQLKNINILKLTSDESLVNINVDELFIFGFPIEDLIIDKNIEYIKSDIGIIIYFPNLKEIYFPDTIKYVDNFMYYLPSLETMSIPYEIKSFKYEKKQKCEKLEKIIIRGKNSNHEIDVKNKNIDIKRKEDLHIKIYDEKSVKKYILKDIQDDFIVDNLENICFLSSDDIENETLNLIDEYKEYDEIIIKSKLECKKLIMDINSIKKIKFGHSITPPPFRESFPNLKEITIKEDNEMLLNPKEFNLKLDESEQLIYINYNDKKETYEILINNIFNNMRRYILLDKYFRVVDTDKIDEMYITEDYPIEDKDEYVFDLSVNNLYKGLNDNKYTNLSADIFALKNLKKINIVFENINYEFNIIPNTIIENVSLVPTGIIVDFKYEDPLMNKTHTCHFNNSYKKITSVENVEVKNKDSKIKEKKLGN